MNNNIEFIPERDLELFNAYKDALRSADVRSHQQAILKAIKTPTSRFWVSTFQAYRSILRLRKGENMGAATRDTRRDMFLSIYERYKAIEKKPEFRGCSTYFIVSFAVQQQAPEFYISYSRASAIITKMKKQARENAK